MDKNYETKEILNYVKNNISNMSDDMREFLIRYAVSKSRLNPYEIYSVNKRNFLNDLKILTDSYVDCNNTALTAKRMSYIIDLFNKASFCEDELDLEDLSLRLDKLYIDSGLSVRNTDTVLKKIRNSRTDERIKNGR